MQLFVMSFVFLFYLIVKNLFLLPPPHKLMIVRDKDRDNITHVHVHVCMHQCLHALYMWVNVQLYMYKRNSFWYAK